MPDINAPEQDMPLAPVTRDVAAICGVNGRTFEWAALALILLLGLSLRLYHVNEPPVDFQSWRDTQTLMVARNFYRDGMNLFHPCVDLRNTDPYIPDGTVGASELQVVPYLTAALYYIFGIRYWVNRVIPISFALLGALYFYLLVRRFYGRGCALVATLLLTVSPYYLYCGRVQMPEPFAYAMAFAAFYHFDRWLWDRRRGAFLVALIFSVLMILGKPQLIVPALILAFLTFQRHGMRSFATPHLYIFKLAALAPIAAYAWYSWVVLASRSGISYAGASLLDYGRYLGDPQYYAQIGVAVWQIALTPPVAVLAIAGLFVPVRDRKAWLAYVWLLVALLFFLAMPGGNITNGYYHLILVPPAVILATRVLMMGLTRRRLRVLAYSVLVGMVGYCLYTAKDFYTPYYASTEPCGQWVDQHAPRDALVLTASANPATLYFCDRVGWTSWKQTFGPELVDTTAALGAQVVAVSDPWFDNAYYPDYNGVRDMLYDRFLCHHGPDFAIFFIDQAADLSVPPDSHVTFGVPESRKYLRGTWGPNQDEPSLGRFVALGPSTHGIIVFTAPRPVSRIALDIASTVANQEIAIRLNDQTGPGLLIPTAYQRGNVVVESSGAAPPDGRNVIVLDASQRNERGASILLYGLQVQAVL